MTRCSKCCEDFNILPVHLLLPHLMGADGREFIDAHGIDVEEFGELREGAILLDSGEVKIKHRCRQLTVDGLCSIYEQRPAICRAFDCSLKSDCLNNLNKTAASVVPLDALRAGKTADPLFGIDPELDDEGEDE